MHAIKLNSQNCDAHSGYGILLQKTSYGMYDFKKAMKHYELACSVETDPNVSLFCLNYARAIWRSASKTQDYEKVLYYAEKSFKHDPKLSPGYSLAAMASYKLMNYFQCVEYNEKSFELSNNFDRHRVKTSYIASKLFVVCLSNNKNDTIIDDDVSVHNRLYDEYLESNGYLIPLDDDKIGIKHLSYFNEMEIHSNNEILKSVKDINYLIDGYVQKYTKNIYDLSVLIKIIKNYFGLPGNECIFCVDNRSRKLHIKLKKSNAIISDSNVEADLGHLYRSVIFNHS